MAGHTLKLVKRASGGRPAKISREQILEVARQLRAGEFTFPHIAKKLGVRPPALYYHFGSREELLHALAVELAKEFTLKPGNPKRWRPWLEETALRFYDFLLANPTVFEVDNWRGLSALGLPIIETVLETLEGAGFSLEEAGHVWEVVSNLAYAEARIINDIRRAGPALATIAAAGKIDKPPPRMRKLMALSSKDPREQVAKTIHWLVTALPRPRS